MSASKLRPQPPLPLQHLRDLTLQQATHTAGQHHFSAASGLVCAYRRAYVMADDEHHLAVFEDRHSPGRLWPLFAGQLPSDKKARKRAKPDTETLLLLPAPSAASTKSNAQGRPQRPHGALLSLGSGSKPKRCRAVCLALDALGEPLPTTLRHIDLQALYAPLQSRLGDLNIEGAFFSGSQFVLLQRGHAGGSANLSLRYSAAQALAWLDGLADAPALQAIQHHDLGDLHGVTLTFTDGSALPGGAWLFSAAAEDTQNTVADGACLGSALGVMSSDGELQALLPLPGTIKVEGIAARRWRGQTQVCLVTDADDPQVASQMFTTGWTG